MNVFDGFQGRLPVRWMAIESLNYSVYTTKSDVYVHSSAPTHFNCYMFCNRSSNQHCHDKAYF